jgi:hypothetical protein
MVYISNHPRAWDLGIFKDSLNHTIYIRQLAYRRKYLFEDYELSIMLNFQYIYVVKLFNFAIVIISDL